MSMIYDKVWDEVTYPFPKSNGKASKFDSG